jgi:16S rRNA C967 or C1407 C5-methylase (RsmB/RsmF family)
MTSIKPKVVEDGKEESIIAPGIGRNDVVLVDAPCTGLGSLRRNPDIKWLPGRERQSLAPVGPDTMDFQFDAERHLNRDTASSPTTAQTIAPLPSSLIQGSGGNGWAHTIQHMASVQKRLLNTYSSLVKPGGRLVYGVCTFSNDETKGVVDDFLSNHPDFSLGPGGYLGKSL